MKSRTLKKIKIICLIIIGVTSNMVLQAQDEDVKPPERPVRNMFESNWIMDNQTVIVPIKGTLEMDIQHRFGTWDNGYDDFFGIYAPSNIRLGFTKVVAPHLQLGFGLTKNNNLWDFNAKYALFQQTMSGSTPLSMTLYTNMAIDSRDGKFFVKGSDRFTYFYQIMLARKFSDKFSLQLSGNLSHFNAVEGFLDSSNEVTGVSPNDHLSTSLYFRYRLTDVSNLTFGYDLPLSDHEMVDNKGNLSFGIEFVTSAHAFQLFLGNFQGIVPQYNHHNNVNSFGDNEILIGFNITRLWN